ncbi:hypothetical protein C8F01DRAFT_1233586 [Mycena amicta]|nr:hypothetical protein C8F01DRAFT_1233586 [Mycena amicta]
MKFSPLIALIFAIVVAGLPTGLGVYIIAVFGVLRGCSESSSIEPALSPLPTRCDIQRSAPAKRSSAIQGPASCVDHDVVTLKSLLLATMLPLAWLAIPFIFAILFSTVDAPLAIVEGFSIPSLPSLHRVRLALSGLMVPLLPPATRQELVHEPVVVEQHHLLWLATFSVLLLAPPGFAALYCSPTTFRRVAFANMVVLALLTGVAVPQTPTIWSTLKDRVRVLVPGVWEYLARGSLPTEPAAYLIATLGTSFFATFEAKQLQEQVLVTQNIISTPMKLAWKPSVTGAFSTALRLPFHLVNYQDLLQMKLQFSRFSMPPFKSVIAQFQLPNLQPVLALVIKLPNALLSLLPTCAATLLTFKLLAISLHSRAAATGTLLKAFSLKLHVASLLEESILLCPVPMLDTTESMMCYASDFSTCVRRFSAQAFLGRLVPTNPRPARLFLSLFVKVILSWLLSTSQYVPYAVYLWLRATPPNVVRLWQVGLLHNLRALSQDIRAYPGREVQLWVEVVARARDVQNPPRYQDRPEGDRSASEDSKGAEEAIPFNEASPTQTRPLLLCWVKPLGVDDGLEEGGGLQTNAVPGRTDGDHDVDSRKRPERTGSMYMSPSGLKVVTLVVSAPPAESTRNGPALRLSDNCAETVSTHLASTSQTHIPRARTGHPREASDWLMKAFECNMRLTHPPPTGL